MGRRRSGGGGEALFGALSLLLPLGLYLWTAAPAPTWLDSGELLAAGLVLGGAHPPGHPVHVTLVKLATLLPLGPLALRATLVSALFAALATFLVSRIAVRLSRALDPASPRWVAPLFGLISSLTLGASTALWEQATRVEVYALQLALVLAALAALIGFGLGARGARDGRLVAAAALAFGLALANHHFLALLLVPGVIVLATEDALASWRRTLRLLLAGCLPAALVGLLPYVHLLLRAGAPGAVSLGTATSASSFFWVVSARAFQRAMVDPPTTPFGDRAVDAAMVVLGQLGPVQSVLALGGLYFLCRQRLALGIAVVLWMIATWLARAWMGFDPGNADVLGYLLVAPAALAVGLARTGPLLATLLPSRPTVRVGAVTVLGLALIGGAAWSGLSARARCDLSAARGSEVVASELLEGLPPRAVVVTDLFQTCFDLWAAQTAWGLRPDVAHVHLPFVGYPGYAEEVHREHRDLRGLLRAALSTGGLTETELSALVQRRAVLVEPSISSPGELDPFLLPKGLLWEASAEPLGASDLRLAVPAHDAAWEELLVAVGPSPDDQTSRVLLWRSYVDALLLARRGEREAATAAAERGLRLAPGTPELSALVAALSDGEGRLDVGPFLPAGLRPAPDAPSDSDEERPDVLEF